MNGGGFGARGEVEHSNQNDANRRVVSIRTARSMSIALNLITLAVYFAIFCYWWFVLIVEYVPASRVSPFLRWWGCVTFVVTNWARVMGRTWPLWLMPLALEWIKPQWELYRHNLRPKLYNDNWPPPSAQVPPMESGFLTADNWDARAGVAPLVVAPPATLITLDIVDGSTHRYLTDIEVTPELQRFALGVLAGVVSFSERGATGCHWDKRAFKDLRDQMIDRKMITWKNGHNKRSGYNIGPIARRALGELAGERVER